MLGSGNFGGKRTSNNANVVLGEPVPSRPPDAVVYQKTTPEQVQWLVGRESRQGRSYFTPRLQRSVYVAIEIHCTSTQASPSLAVSLTLLHNHMGAISLITFLPCPLSRFGTFWLPIIGASCCELLRLGITYVCHFSRILLSFGR